MMTQERSTLIDYRISTLFAADSLVKVFRLLESGVDLTTREEHFSLKSLVLPPLKDLCFCVLKMFPDFFRTKNYSQAGEDIIVDNTQLTIFG